MNMIAISSSISIIIYLLFFVGVVLFEFDTIETLVHRFRIKRKLKKKHEEDKISLAARNLLASSLGKDIDGIWLILAVALIFVVSFFVALRNFSFLTSVLVAIFCSALPLLLLYSKMEALRNKGSQEGISLLTELYRQYKMNSSNILKAIELTISAQGDYPVCRKQLYILLIRLQDAASTDEIKKDCKALSFSLGGNWGRSLASSIEIAASKGTDISLALIDIMDQLKTAKRLAEERKRMNGESMRMILFLVPFLYLMTVFVSFKYLSMPVSKFIRNQFFTPKGLLFFIVNICLFVINMCFMNIISSSRMDY